MHAALRRSARSGTNSRHSVQRVARCAGPSARAAWRSARGRAVSSTPRSGSRSALHLLRQRGLQVGEVEQVDVEVAQVAGDRLEALELVAEVLQALGVDRLELALQRARAADGDAQVVQELASRRPRACRGGCRRSPRAGGRRRSRRPRSRARRGRASRSSLALVPAGRAAGGGDRLVDERHRRLGQRERQQRVDALELGVVAAHGGGGDARAGPRGSRREPDDGLLVLVEDGERLTLARADLAPPASARASRSRRRAGRAAASGEVVVEQPLRPRVRSAAASSSPVSRSSSVEPAARVAQRHALAVQAAVERVVERRDAVARAARAHVECAAIARDRRRQAAGLHDRSPVSHARYGPTAGSPRRTS